ncbi:hypothetical protein JAAARDRAFT_198759 [Jaapia argillacea MUCL 33604]|uniref:F-box domain-containing protein n=1 Tax=Jaapia argillacea MUCL 33604 TaxID=933084 RepID=A0A067PAU6_9AGAM|nr:hypothetical protein JAAARDRAFT_198759 [Jaapia argillacea MUCL 33604]
MFRLSRKPKKHHFQHPAVDPSNLPSSAALLPELTAAILQHVLQDPTDLKTSISNQIGLHTALQVCRTWYNCSISLLYAQPILGPGVERTFLRTIKKDSNLAKLVRTLVIQAPFFAAGSGFFLTQLPAFDQNVHSRWQADVISLFDLCPYLTSLALRPVHPDWHNRLRCEIHPSHLQNLRRLSLHGYTASSLFFGSDFFFPNLEELSLERLVETGPIIWPSCPSLRRLSLTNCHFPGGTLLPTTSQHIQQVELWGFSSDDADIRSALNMHESTLESLRMDCFRLVESVRGIDFARFIQLKHFTIIGVSDATASHSLLRTLSTIPQLEELVYGCVIADIQVISSLLRQDQLGNLFPQLRLLALPRLSQEESHGIQLMYEELETLCRTRNIKVEVNNNAAPSPNSAWVREFGLRGILRRH